MNTTTNIKDRELVRDNVNVGTEATKTALGVGIGMATLVGLWAVACLIGGIASAGLIGAVAGYVRAVTGM